MAVETSHEADVTALEKLAAELGARGFDTHLTTPADRLPFLTVRNPQAAQLTEVILADGGSFWWSWACATRRCYSEWRWKTIHPLAVAAAG
jgi:hypothetical protein